MKSFIFNNVTDTDWGAIFIVALMAIGVWMLFWVDTQEPFSEPSIYELTKPAPIQELSITEQIQAIADNHNFPADTLLAIAECESGLDLDAVGGSYNCFIGLYQYNICLTDMPVSCAANLECSTIATIEALQKGEGWRWPACSI